MLSKTRKISITNGRYTVPSADKEAAFMCNLLLIVIKWLEMYPSVVSLICAYISLFLVNHESFLQVFNSNSQKFIALTKFGFWSNRWGSNLVRYEYCLRVFYLVSILPEKSITKYMLTTNGYRITGLNGIVID